MKHSLRVAPWLILGCVAAAAQELLPDHIGNYGRGRALNLAAPASERALLGEYGLKAEERAAYASADRKMEAEVLQFADSDGAYAAYLALRPTRAIDSPLRTYYGRNGVFAQVRAVLGGGTTVVQYKNYVLRFRRAAPSSSQLSELMLGLPGLDSAEPGSADSHYLDRGSERVLLGPVSLAKFARKIPPSVVAIETGARGRVARFETPGGTMSRMVFEYTSASLAQEKLAGFRALAGAKVRLTDRRIAVIFNPQDEEEASQLLEDIAQDTAETPAVDFNPQYHDDSLAAGFAGVLFWSGLGGAVAALCSLFKPRKAFPDPKPILGLTS